MTTNWASRPIPWGALSKAEYVRMKNAWLEHWRPVIPQRSRRLVLTEIVRWQNFETGASFSGFSRIATKTGLSAKTVQRAVRDLERTGLLTVERLKDAKRRPDGMLTAPRVGGRSNHYWIDYNAVCVLDCGLYGWRIRTDNEHGVLARAIERATSSPVEGPEVSRECPPNGLYGSNATNGSNGTIKVLAGGVRARPQPNFLPRLFVSASTSLSEIERHHPKRGEAHPVADWSLFVETAWH